MQQYRKYLWSPDMEATYLSRSISKMLSAEEPVGDPFGGAAYGRKEFSLRKAAGFVAAAVAIVATAGAAAPLLAGTLTVASVSAGLVVAGSALTIAGMATGNQKLTKIGGVLGLAGGIGMAANAALGATSATQSGGLASGLDDTITASAQASDDIVNAGSGVSGQSGVAGQVADDLVPQVADDTVRLAEAGSDLSGSARDLNASAVDGGGGFPSPNSAPANTPPVSVNAQPAPVSANPKYDPTPGYSPSKLEIADYQNRYSDQVSSGLIRSVQDAGSGVLEFANKNPTLAFLAGNTAVSAIGGAAEASAKEDSENKARQQSLDDRQFYNDSINGYNLQYDYSKVRSPYANPPQQLNQFQPPPQLVYDPQQQRYVPARPQQGLIANNMQRPAA